MQTRYRTPVPRIDWIFQTVHRCKAEFQIHSAPHKLWKGQGSCSKGHAWNFRWGPEHQKHEMTSQICIELLPFKVNTVSHWCLCWKSLGHLRDQITQISTELCSGTSVALTHQGLWMWRLNIYLIQFTFINLIELSHT